MSEWYELPKVADSFDDGKMPIEDIKMAYSHYLTALRERLYASQKVAADISEAYRRLSRWEEATEQAREAQQIFQKLGDRLGEAKSLNNWGNIYAD